MKVKKRLWMKALGLIIKLVKYSKNGLQPEEIQSLAHDLLELGAALLEEAIEELNAPS